MNESAVSGNILLPGNPLPYFTMYLILCHSGAIAAQGSYTEGVWHVHINDLNCTGSEQRVLECPHNGIVGYSCNHRQDASVMCQGK